jgi:hypothetical protein
MALAAGKQNGVRVNLYELRKQMHFVPDAWFAHLIGRKPAPEELAAVQGDEEAQRVGLILSSPAFQRC